MDVTTHKVMKRMEDCVEKVVKYYKEELDRLPDEDGILDIDVTFDGKLHVYRVLFTIILFINLCVLQDFSFFFTKQYVSVTVWCTVLHFVGCCYNIIRRHMH